MSCFVPYYSLPLLRLHLPSTHLSFIWPPSHSLFLIPFCICCYSPLNPFLLRLYTPFSYFLLLTFPHSVRSSVSLFFLCINCYFPTYSPFLLQPHLSRTSFSRTFNHLSTLQSSFLFVCILLLFLYSFSSFLTPFFCFLSLAFPQLFCPPLFLLFSCTNLFFLYSFSSYTFRVLPFAHLSSCIRLRSAFSFSCIYCYFTITPFLPRQHLSRTRTFPSLSTLSSSVFFSCIYCYFPTFLFFCSHGHLSHTSFSRTSNHPSTLQSFFSSRVCTVNFLLLFFFFTHTPLLPFSPLSSSVRPPIPFSFTFLTGRLPPPPPPFPLSSSSPRPLSDLSKHVRRKLLQ